MTSTLAPTNNDAAAMGGEEQPPRRHRPPAEVDLLARDIVDLGRLRWEARGRGRIQVPAGELPEPHTPPMVAKASITGRCSGTHAADLAFTRSKSRRLSPQHQQKIPPPHLSSSNCTRNAVGRPVPRASVLSPLLDAVSDTAALNLTDVAYTLEEVERSLFNPMSSEHADTLAGVGTSAVRATSPAAAAADDDVSPFVTADDDMLRGRAENPPAAAPAAGAAPAAPPFPPALSSSPQRSRKEAAARSVHGMEPAIVKAAPAPAPPTPPARREAACSMNGSLPRCISRATAAAAQPEDDLVPSPLFSEGLLSVRYDPGVAAYIVCAGAAIPTARHLVAALSDTLTRLEVYHDARGSGASVTSVMLHFSSATANAYAAARGVSAPVTHYLQPMESELALLPLARVRLAERKEALLSRLSTAASRGLRVTAVVDGNSQFPFTDLAAELLLCCADIYTVGHLDMLVVGFPSVSLGVLPAPSTLQALRRRVERAMTDGRLHVALLAALRSEARTAEGVMAVLVSRLHTERAAAWAAFGLWEPARVQESLMASWVAVPQKLYTRLFPGSTTTETPPSKLPPLLPPQTEEWERYCAAACGKESTTRLAWRELLLRVLDSAACRNCHALYRHATRESRILDEPHSIVHVHRTSMPLHLSVDALCGAVAWPRHVSVVFDADLLKDDRERLLAELQASLAELKGSASATASVPKCSVVLVGDPHTLATCLSLVPLAAVVAPVGEVSTRRTPICAREEGRPPLPAVEFSGLFEVALMPSPNVTLSEGRANTDAASEALIHVQAGAVQFLQSAGHPFILTATGDEGLRATAGLVLALCGARAAAAEASLPFTAVVTALAQRLRFARPLGETLRSVPLAGLQRHVVALAKKGCSLSGATHESIGARDVTQLLHALSAERETPRVVAMDAGTPTVVQELVDTVALSVLDDALVALLQGRLACARDADLLSVAALGISSATGGLLTWADSEAQRRGLDNVILGMEMVADRSGRAFPSLPLLRWMQDSGVALGQLDEATLRRTRTALKE